MKTIPLTASDLMSPRLLTVSPSMGLRDLVDFLRENRIHGTLVQEGNRLVGVVSLTDLVVYLSDEAVESEHCFSHLFLSDEALDFSDAVAERLDAAQVRDVMTPTVMTCGAGDTAGEVAAMMRKRGIHRAVVMEKDQAVGLISATDLMRALERYESFLVAHRPA